MSEQGQRPADAVEEIRVEVRVGYGGSKVEGCTSLAVSPRLRNSAFEAWRNEHGFATNDLGDTVAAGYRIVVHAASELLTSPTAASRVPALRETMRQAAGDEKRAELALRRYLELATLAYAAARASDANDRARLMAAAVSMLGEHNHGVESDLDHATLAVAVELIVGSLSGPFVNSSTWSDFLWHPVKTLRRKIRCVKLLRWLRLYLPRLQDAASRMLPDDNYLAVARGFARAALGGRAFLSVAFSPSSEAESPLDILLRPQVNGGFSPGDPHAEAPHTHNELIAWYWSRAKVLRTMAPLIRRLEEVSREVSTLERVTAHEKTSFGLPLSRALRHRAFRPDDDLESLDFSTVLPCAELSLVGDALTFGTPTLTPMINVPMLRIRTHVAAGSRTEKVIVQSAAHRLSALSSNLDDIECVLFIRDSSGSMAGLVPGSSLDAVTLGIFSVLKTLAATGAAQRMRFGLLDFSDRTVFSGWVAIDRLGPIEHLAVRPQGGGTSFDVTELNHALSGKPRALVLLMTDGALAVEHGTDAEAVALLGGQRTFVIAAAQAVSGFCEKAAQAGIETLVLPTLSAIEEVFAGLLGTNE